MTPEAKRLKEAIHMLACGAPRDDRRACTADEQRALGLLSYYATDDTLDHLARAIAGERE